MEDIQFQFYTSDGRFLSIEDLPVDSTDIYLPRIRLTRFDEGQGVSVTNGNVITPPTEPSHVTTKAEPLDAPFDDCVIESSICHDDTNFIDTESQTTERGSQEYPDPLFDKMEVCESETSVLPVSEGWSCASPIKLEPKHEFISEDQWMKVEMKTEAQCQDPHVGTHPKQQVLNNVISAATRAANGLRPKPATLNYGGYWLAECSGEENSDTDEDCDYEPVAQTPSTTNMISREPKVKEPALTPRPSISNNCRTCSVEFSTKADLKAHWRTKEHAKLLIGQKRNEAVYPCSFCGEIFQRRKARNEHESTHKAYSCKICGNRFSQLGQVSIHMRIHTRETPYGCTKCEKRFNQKTHLQRHMRIHSRDLPFSCHKCTMRFNQKCNLVRHLNSHASGTLRHLPTK